LELFDLGPFCAGFGDNLVTVIQFWPLAHMSVTNSAFGLLPLNQTEHHFTTFTEEFDPARKVGPGQPYGAALSLLN
jgi:hypothetical protein